MSREVLTSCVLPRYEPCGLTTCHLGLTCCTEQSWPDALPHVVNDSCWLRGLELRVKFNLNYWNFYNAIRFRGAGHVWTTCPGLLLGNARPGVEPATCLQVQRPNHYTSEPYRSCLYLRYVLHFQSSSSAIEFLINVETFSIISTWRISRTVRTPHLLFWTKALTMAYSTDDTAGPPVHRLWQWRTVQTTLLDHLYTGSDNGVQYGRHCWTTCTHRATPEAAVIGSAGF